jgi:hypothetical protein
MWRRFLFSQEFFELGVGPSVAGGGTSPAAMVGGEEHQRRKGQRPVLKPLKCRRLELRRTHGMTSPRRRSVPSPRDAFRCRRPQGVALERPNKCTSVPYRLSTRRTKKMERRRKHFCSMSKGDDPASFSRRFTGRGASVHRRLSDHRKRPPASRGLYVVRTCTLPPVERLAERTHKSMWK